ncbi:hypothetical protein [Corynebacterium sp. UBA2622]|uniref:hypothetical protein n=1 Tax=Corynebacterium sp. UBA2622 TaxID=1946393 RepID=UPI0025C487D2|nr:hypothetical protein [Corynebacterium sp. UBA2622]
MKKLVSALCACLLVSAAPAQAYEIERSYENNRTAIVVYHPDGRWSGTSDALEPRPALSLAKLYLGYYVLYHGTDEEKDLVKDMIRMSNNSYAEKLDEAHPEAIRDIAAEFGLPHTERNGAWGWTTTSPYDVAKFLASIVWDPQAKPLLDGMRSVPDTADDGFRQVFGTAKLDHVEGFKTGWSNDEKSQTGSVAFGEIGDETWVAAALTNGDAYDNTTDTIRGIRQIDETKQRSPLLRPLRNWRFGDGFPAPFKKLGS